MQQKAAVKYENDQTVQWWTRAAKAKLFQPSVHMHSHTNTLINRFNKTKLTRSNQIKHKINVYIYMHTFELQPTHINVKAGHTVTVLTEHHKFQIKASRQIPISDSRSIHILYGLRWVSFAQICGGCVKTHYDINVVIVYIVKSYTYVFLLSSGFLSDSVQPTINLPTPYRFIL